MLQLSGRLASRFVTPLIISAYAIGWSLRGQNTGDGADPASLDFVYEKTGRASGSRWRRSCARCTRCSGEDKEGAGSERGHGVEPLTMAFQGYGASRARCKGRGWSRRGRAVAVPWRQRSSDRGLTSLYRSVGRGSGVVTTSSERPDGQGTIRHAARLCPQTPQL